MSKTYTELVEEISPQEIDELYEYALHTEKNMSKDEVAELIDDAISAATQVKNDPKKSDKHKRTASSVLSKVRSMKKTFEKDGSIHPNAVNALMRVVTGVHSGRYGYMNKNNPKVPQNYAREEDETLQEGMTGSIAKVLAMGLKRKVIGIGNQVQSATDLEEKINLLSKQINVIAGLVLTTISVSDEKGLLSKGAILTSLLSSHEPDADLDILFEGEI
ncbi:hypothetical protein HOM13_03745 [Candidatus Woesearchaeota archaeon]|jgi:hypothetical protein|nr:hypothetical protein [Candidatus Woesearchaeota archaeon]